jgi:predicted anti-sigma-YlaC factor YlaD
VIDGQIACVDIVEMVTDWMEGGLDDDTRALVEEHLVLCAPCQAYVSQIHQVVHVVRDLGNGALPRADVRLQLLEAFRAEHRG